MSVQENIQIIRALSNDLAGFLYTLPEDVWRDADVYASACDRWNMADVVAHLIDVANTFTLSIERAVSGNASPPMGNRKLSSDEWIESIISLRDAYGEDLFPEFNTACLRFNRLIMELEPDQYELPAWHPFRVMTVERLIELRAMELAVHGWDVRYGIDRSAAINPVAIQFLKGWVPRWLRACFRPSGPRTIPMSGCASSSPTPETSRTTYLSAQTTSPWTRQTRPQTSTRPSNWTQAHTSCSCWAACPSAAPSAEAA